MYGAAGTVRCISPARLPAYGNFIVLLLLGLSWVVCLGPDGREETVQTAVESARTHGCAFAQTGLAEKILLFGLTRAASTVDSQGR